MDFFIFSFYLLSKQLLKLFPFIEKLYFFYLKWQKLSIHRYEDIWQYLKILYEEIEIMLSSDKQKHILWKLLITQVKVSLYFNIILIIIFRFREFNFYLTEFFENIPFANKKKFPYKHFILVVDLYGCYTLWWFDMNKFFGVCTIVLESSSVKIYCQIKKISI